MKRTVEMTRNFVVRSVNKKSMNYFILDMVADTPDE